MSDSSGFGKMVPGFDFMQSLLKSASAAAPAVGQWIAPTLDPAELDKRINDLKTVQFWLEQNARLLGATIQALEVQRMTLTTLQSMNLPVADMAAAFKLRVPEPAAPEPEPEPEPEPPAAAPEAEAPAAASTAAGVVDPMQWWGALTKQFGDIAAGALRDSAAEAAHHAAAKAVAPAAAKPRAATATKAAARKTTPRRRT